MSDERFENTIRGIIGKGEGEDIVIRAPPLRDYDAISDEPFTHAALDMLSLAGEEQLEALGLRKWHDVAGLWLFPYEWHADIPGDYLLIDTDGEPQFRHELGATPAEQGGLLPAGFIPEFEREGDQHE